MSDENLYAQAAHELQEGTAEAGLLAKAFAKAGGDEMRTRANYMELRVSQLKTEAAEKRGRELAQKHAKIAERAFKTLGKIIFALFLVIFIPYCYYLTAPGPMKTATEPPPNDAMQPTPAPAPEAVTTFARTQAERGKMNYLYRWQSGGKTQQESLKIWADDLTRRSKLVKTPEEIQAYTEERNVYLEVLSESKK